VVALLERWGSGGRTTLYLDPAQGSLTIGKSVDCGIVIADDPTVSRLHARLEPIGPRWNIEDLGSRNGTIVNGKRVERHILKHEDEILLGRTTLAYRDVNAQDLGETTEPVGQLPKLTDREKEVLRELCRPIVSGKAFSPPASAKQIGEALYVGEPAIRQHLSSLYDKFGILEEGTEPRRVRLANDALLRGAVTMSDFKAPPDLS
jgi:DNA-binding CsgD family transcriptional regulator